MRKKVGTFLLFIMLLTSSIFVFQMKQIKATEKTNGDWWNTDWNYRKLITINSSQVESTLSNFPVLINLASDSDLVAHAQTDGDDIAFVLDSDNTQLDHEIETFNATTGELVCWVNVTSLSSTVDTMIWMYYGNSDCSSQQNPTETWNSNFISVHHLEEPSGTIQDSTSSNNDLTFYNSPTYVNSFIVDGAYDFDGVSEYGTLTTNDFNISGGTVECWVEIDTFPATGNEYIFAHYTTNPVANRIYMQLYNNKKWGCGIGDNPNTVTGSTLTENTKYYLSMTWDGIYAHGYLNGTSDFGDTSYSNLNSTGNIYFMAWNASHEYIDGTIDEFRVSKIERNSSWIKTTYNTIINPLSFISVGIEEMQSNIIVFDPYPADGAIGVELTPIMSISVSHSSGNQMNITWKWNNSGSWDIFGTNYSVFNGTYNQINMNFSSNQTTYEWRVEVDDGIGNWNNKTYSFTTLTEDNESPIVNITCPQLGFIYIYVLVTSIRLHILPTNSTLIIGKIEIKADITDNKGISWVKFYINDELRATISEKPYIWDWNELTIYDLYKIKVVASDFSGNQGSDEVEVWKIQLFEIGL